MLYKENFTGYLKYNSKIRKTIVKVIIILTLLNQRLYNHVCRIIAKKTFVV